MNEKEKQISNKKIILKIIAFLFGSMIIYVLYLHKKFK